MRKSLEVFGIGFRHFREMLHGLFDEVHHIQALGFFSPTGEGLVSKIAGETNAA